MVMGREGRKAVGFHRKKFGWFVVCSSRHKINEITAGDGFKFCSAPYEDGCAVMIWFCA